MTIDISTRAGFNWQAADTFICIDKASDISDHPLCYLYIANNEPRQDRGDSIAAYELIYKDFIRFYETLKPNYKLWSLSTWKRNKPLNRIDLYRLRKEKEASLNSINSGKSFRYEFDELDALVSFAASDISDTQISSPHILLMILPNNANIDEIIRSGWKEMPWVVATFSWDFDFIKKIVEAGGMLTKPAGCSDNSDTFGILGIGAARILASENHNQWGQSRLILTN